MRKTVIPNKNVQGHHVKVINEKLERLDEFV